MKEISDDYGLATLEISEAVPKKKGVLMELKGDSFFRDVPSRNKRSYGGETWPNALAKPEVKRMLENGLMFGTVGHADKSMDDLVRENKVAIRTTGLTFNRQTGIGEGKYEVLDTELGRIVKTLYDTGSKFYVSTKAIGEYKGEDSEGNQKVDPDKFHLKRVDLVCDPGFLQAQPELKEQLEEAYKHEENIVIESQKDNILFINKEEAQVENKELVEKVMGEKLALEGELSSVGKDLEIAETKLKNFGEVEEKNVELTGEVSKLQGVLEAHNDFFEEVGTMDEIKETLIKAKDFGESVSELGGVEAVTEKMEELNAFLELGDDAESMKEALESALSIHEQIAELVDVEEGENPIEKIREGLEKAMDYIKDIKSAGLEEDVSDVASKFGIADEEVKDLVEAKGKEATIEMLEKLKGVKKVDLSEGGAKDVDVEETRSDRMFKGSGNQLSEDNKTEDVSRTDRMFGVK